MQRIKGIAKKLAALSAGAAMLGATMSGALAANLNTYPEPFVNVVEKEYDYQIIFGSKGLAEDSAAVTDIVTGLDGVQVSSGGTAIASTEDVHNEDVPLTLNVVSANQLKSPITDSEINTLIDSSISFKGKSYDVEEELHFSKKDNVTIETSLSTSDDNYGSEVRMEVPKNSVNYIYSFKKAITLSDASTSDEVNLMFLGKPLTITSVTKDTEFSAQVGDELTLGEGESATVEGQTLTLTKVGSSSVMVKIGTEEKTIDKGSEKTFSTANLEVHVDTIFHDANNPERNEAVIIAGADAVETVKDGDSYPGGDDSCDNHDPNDVDCWKWIVKNLLTNATTDVTNNVTGFTYSGPTLGLKNEFALTTFARSPPGAGEYVSLPNEYVSFGYESLTVKDDDYMTLTIEPATDFNSEDIISEAGLATEIPSSTKAVKISSSKADALNIDFDATKFIVNGTVTNDLETDAIYLVSNRTDLGDLLVFYENSDNKKLWAGKVGAGDEEDINRTSEFAYIDFGNVQGTSGTYITIDAGVVKDTDNKSILVRVVPHDTDLGVASDNITTYWNLTTAGDLKGLGDTADKEEAHEINWGNEEKTIGTKDEDHRSKFGIIIKDPSTQGASDKVVLEIPSDMVEAKFVVKGKGASVTSGNQVVIRSLKTPAPSATDEEITSIAGQNVILVGGSCVNKYTAQVLGLTFPACGTDSGLSDGEAVIQIVDNGAENVAMVVAGWAAEDTRRAGRALRNYSVYSADLTGAKVKVEGVGLTVNKVSAAGAAATTTTTTDTTADADATATA